MRSNRVAVLALLAAPFAAGAADVPPAPVSGATLEERLYLVSDTADDVGLLVARVACVAYQRAMIDARLEAGLLARGWSAEADRLWRLSEALAAFEDRHIRPMIDAETEQALLSLYVRESPAGGADDPRAAHCGSFADIFVLRRILG